MELSQRLQAVVNMVTPGNIVADVGCDHAYVSIYLIEKEVCKKVIAMDVNTGPLGKAKEHIAEYAYSEYIETRLSDGVSALKVGEVDTLICAGMGGRLTVKILDKGKDKIFFMKELILQPQSEVWYVRKYLKNLGFSIVQENMIFEDGKYYSMMRAVQKKSSVYKDYVYQIANSEERLNISSDKLKWLYEKYGKNLLLNNNPILKEYLLEEIIKLEDILQVLNKETGSQKQQQRFEELEREVDDIHLALEFFV